jgi:choice-of-anchor B domain-containing protein
MKKDRVVLAAVLCSLGTISSLSAQSFGNAVVVGDDQIIVGEPSYEMRSGVAYVFERDGSGSWVEKQRLEPELGEAGNRFGIRLARQDGTLLVSATRADEGTGAIYIFTNEEGTWTETGRLETSDRSPADSLGTGLAIDGDWILVGTIAQNGARGATYAFRRQGQDWLEHSKIVPEGVEQEARFGSEIALSDGRALIAAPSGGGGTGTVYAYQYDAASDRWQAQGQLQAPALEEQAGFGTEIELVGPLALVGAPGVFQGTGVAFAYASFGGQWQFASIMQPFETQGGVQFGSSISFDGETALIGAPGAQRGAGRLYEFTLDGRTGEWTSARKIGSGAPGRELFAASVDRMGDVVVSAALGADRRAGAVYVLEREMGVGDWMASGRLVGDVLGMEAVLGEEVPCSDDGESAGFECSSVDLISFLPVQEMAANRGVSTNDVWGWTDPQSGKEIVIVGMSDQTAFVDISNPGQPTYLGRLPMHEGANPSTWRDMKVYEDHVFVVSDGAGQHGMQVFDLTRLRGLDGTNPPTLEEDAHYDQIASAHNIVINEETGFAYSVGSRGGGETCGGGLHMINIQDPTNPTFAGCFQDMTTGRQRTGYSHDAQCVVYRGPDEDYRGREICLGANETALSIADVTDKANPVAVSMASYPNVGYSHQGWLSEDHSYFFMGDELDETGGNVATTRTLIWDLADLDDPVLAREFMAETKATDHNLYILGNTMYQSNYKSGLVVYDVSDPENPVKTGQFDTVPYGGDDASMGGSWSNYPYFESGVVVVTSGREGLFLVRYRPQTISE